MKHINHYIKNKNGNVTEDFSATIVCINCNITELKILGTNEDIDFISNIYCSTNEIESLQLSRCINLGILHCNSNKIKHLNLSNNLKLKRLVCDPISNIDDYFNKKDLKITIIN